jgi:tetratricopeptide (TPR) repeat protein
MDLDALKAALAASPDNLPLLLLVAQAHEDRFELDEARRHLDRALAVDPDHGPALVGIARLLDLQGDTSEAIVRLEVLCEAQPEFGPGWMLRARLLLEEGEGASARQCYDRAVALDRKLADDGLLESILAKGGALAPH